MAWPPPNHAGSNSQDWPPFFGPGFAEFMRNMQAGNVGQGVDHQPGPNDFPFGPFGMFAGSHSGPPFGGPPFGGPPFGGPWGGPPGCRGRGRGPPRGRGFFGRGGPFRRRQANENENENQNQNENQEVSAEEQEQGVREKDNDDETLRDFTDDPPEVAPTDAPHTAPGHPGPGHGPFPWGYGPPPWARRHGRHHGPPGPPPFAPEWIRRLYNFFNNSTDESARQGAQNEDSFTPPVDVFNTERAFILHVAVPGAKKEDVGVNWDGDKNQLNIAGVVYRPGDEQFLQNLVSSERKIGMFERTVTLPPAGNGEKDEVDGLGITAKMEDGILVITVPKAEKEWTEVRKVDIE